VVGHIWPVWHRFRGGRGLAPIYATVLVIDWLGMFVTSIIGMAFGLFVVRSFPSPTWPACGCWCRGSGFAPPWEYVAFALAPTCCSPSRRCRAAPVGENPPRGEVERPDRADEAVRNGPRILKLARRFGVAKPR